MTSTADLEAACRRLVAQEHTHRGPSGHLIREMALVLEQLEAVRNHEQHLEDRLNERELGLKTRMLNLKTPPREYDWDRWARRKQLTHQLETSLTRLEQQAQRLAIDREQRLHALQDRLLSLWGRWAQVDGADR